MGWYCDVFSLSWAPAFDETDPCKPECSACVRCSRSDLPCPILTEERLRWDEVDGVEGQEGNSRMWIFSKSRWQNQMQRNEQKELLKFVTVEYEKDTKTGGMETLPWRWHLETWRKRWLLETKSRENWNPKTWGIETGKIGLKEHNQSSTSFVERRIYFLKTFPFSLV